MPLYWLPYWVGVLPGVGAEVDVPGNSDCGSVARSAAAGDVGKYRGPDCPQATKVTMAKARVRRRTRIWLINFMAKL
jgi:hypothetical protein